MSVDPSVSQHAPIVMSTMPVAIARCSADLRYLWVSERYASWLGIPAAEITGKLLVDVLGQEGLASIRPYVEVVLAGKRVEYEAFVCFKNIGRRWIHAEYSPTSDASGAVDGWVACVLDVTDRKGAEQRVAVAHTALARLFELSVMPGGEEAMPALLQAVIDTAVDVSDAHMGTLHLYDQATESLHIVAHRGFQPPFLAYIATVHDSPSASCEAMKRRASVIVEDVSTSPLFVGPAMAVMEAAGVRAVQATPMMSREGRLLGVFSTYWRAPHPPVHDALGPLEIIARQAADMIEHRQQEERLREANRRKDEFLAMLGHELRNPLAPILTATDLMKLRGDGTTERERDIIERQAKYLVRLVDDLLDVARITRGTIELRKERVDLAEVVAKAIEIASPLLEQRLHRLSVQVSRNDLIVTVDPGRMTQVIGNLLTNAARYTDPGGEIRVIGRVIDDVVTLCVQDTGIGISSAMLPRVFDLFVQEKQALDRPRGGLGLGLAIVRNLVELHRGSVAARSEGIGKGSEFVISLPRSREDSESGRLASVPRHEKPSKSGGARILVVDDNEDGAKTLAAVLEELGHDVRIANEGHAALRVVEGFTPALALLDIGLPVMDGYELARRLREQPRLAGVRLVAMTGYGQESDRRRSSEAGFEAHLVKPVDLGILQDVVRRFTTTSAVESS